MNELVVEEYKKYLKNMIVDGEFCCYNVLLEQLDSILYEPNQLNTDRYEDAEQLRIDYGIDNNIEDVLSYFKDTPITVFEVLVALSMRLEKKVIPNNKKGDRTSQWFWALINDIDLGKQDDECCDSNIIDEIVKEWMSEKNKTSLWKQAMNIINRLERS